MYRRLWLIGRNMSDKKLHCPVCTQPITSIDIVCDKEGNKTSTLYIHEDGVECIDEGKESKDEIEDINV